MGQLTADEIAFLDKHKIDAALIYDASGQPSAIWKGHMKQLGKKFAFGTSPCGAGGHKLRTRHGHCIQCDTAQIAFALRHTKAGQLYIMGSEKMQLIKLGYTTDLSSRLANINSMSYGGATDWITLLATNTLLNAGKLESVAHGLLRAHRVEGLSYKAGEVLQTYELLSCPLSIAKTALQKVLPANERIVLKSSPRTLERFERKHAA